MGFDLLFFNDPQLQVDYLDWLVAEQSVDIQMHFGKMWEYYANRMIEDTNSCTYGKNETTRCYVQAQEYGLPTRITGRIYSPNTGVFGGRTVREVQRKEVVIENDIA